MPHEKDRITSLDRVRSARSLGHRSGLIASRTVELARKAKGLQLADDLEVVFPDKHLATAVRGELKNPGGSITRGDLKRLGKLRAGGKRMSMWHMVRSENISGLEHAVNLISLGLFQNNISDVSPLASLINLTSLDLDHNHQISDITPLASLNNLTSLDLRWNQISDITPLASLTNLERLNLARNQVRDVGPLAALTNLERLDLEHNPLSQESVDVHVPALRSKGVYVDL